MSWKHYLSMWIINQAKWHKTCHLKFAPSKLLRAREQWNKKCQLTFRMMSRGDQNSEQWMKNPVFFAHKCMVNYVNAQQWV